MPKDSSRDHTEEDLNNIFDKKNIDTAKKNKAQNRRKQEDLSFLESAREDAEKYYIKLKNNETIPTFYLDLPCPQCGHKTNGHGQKHRVERKCRVCLLTFQLDNWLLHSIQFNTPLKYFIEKCINKLSIITNNSFAKDEELNEEKKQIAPPKSITPLHIERRQQWLEETGNILKKDMDDLAENLQLIVFLYKDLEKKLSRMQKDTLTPYKEKNTQKPAQNKQNNEHKNTAGKNSTNTKKSDKQ